MCQPPADDILMFNGWCKVEADVLVVCAVFEKPEVPSLLQMSGCCVGAAIASTVLHRKILFMVCALFSLNHENLRISNRQMCIYFS